MGMTTMLVVGALTTIASTGFGVYNSIQQSKAQQAQAEYQSAVAQKNQELAEEKASAERRQGYENMINQRQKVAKIIGQQRAAAGASGALVDYGSNLDLQADTASQGEIDAINEYNKGLDSAYNAEIQAWNYGQQAAAYDSQASYAASSGTSNAIGTAIGGIASLGSTWGKYAASSGTNGQWVNNNQDYISGSGTLTKMRSRAGSVAVI